MSKPGQLVAGRGYTLGGIYLAVATEYHIVGPLPAGSVIKHARLAMSCDDATVVFVGAGLTGSRQANLGNFQASSSLIERGETRLQGKNALAYVFTAAGYFEDEFPVGIVMPSGSWYVIFAIQNSGAGDLYMNLSVWPEYGLRFGEPKEPAVAL